MEYFDWETPLGGVFINNSSNHQILDYGPYSRIPFAELHRVSY
jgi:hypothetical protein